MGVMALQKRRAASAGAPEQMAQAQVPGREVAGGAGMPRFLSGAAPTTQPQLRIGRPDDAYEQEADRVADQVVRTPEGAGRAVAGHGAAARGEPSAPAIQRATAGAAPVASAARSVLPAGSGRPLDPTTRADLEARFGHDFGGVRVHTGPPAAQQAASVEARAFTAGSDIVFGAGQYAPGSPAGRHLLAHELAHVLQQRRGVALHVQRNGGGEAAPTAPQPEVDMADWYQRAAAFTSGLEIIQLMLTETVAQVQAEQADWYVFSDRTFTRPVVLKIIYDAGRFGQSVTEFIAQSPQDEPMLAQLREGLASFQAQLDGLRAVTPPPIDTAEAMGRGFVGGVAGAGGAFLSFMRLGLWDSWGQFIFEGSEQRIGEAQEGMMQMMLDIDQQGFGSTVSRYASQGMSRYLENIENEQYTTASRQFGSAAFDTYFAGRGLVSLGQGLRGMSRAAAAARAVGNPRPWLHAAGLAAREMVTFRGVGAHGGRGIWGSSYGAPQVTPGGTVRIIRFVRGEEDLVAKSMRHGETMMLDAQGQPRPVGDVARQHIISSDPGSPFQSAYPYGDVETMVVANPEGLASVAGPRGPGYYVVIEVPADEALLSANRMVLGRSPNPELANLPEVQASRFGLRLPRELRPASLEDVRPQSLFEEPHARLPPETRAWVERNVDFGSGPQSQAALSELQGIQYLEWEQLALAPDLRPYIVDVQPNPLFTGARQPLLLKPSEPSFFHPSLNPRAIAGLAESNPAAVWPRAQTQFDWLLSQSAAGRVPFTTSQIAGAQRMAMLGGNTLPLPLGGAPNVSRPRSPSGEQLRGYLGWVFNATGAVPEAMQQTFEAAVGPPTEQRGVPRPPALGETMRDLGRAAAAIRRQPGSQITGLLSGPNIVSLQVSVEEIADLVAAVRSVIAQWHDRTGEITVALTITVQAERAQANEIARQLGALQPPEHLRIVVRTRAGATVTL